MFHRDYGVHIVRLYGLVWVKRESGENPERSRHCVREFAFKNTEFIGKGKQALIEVRRPA